jgi:uncharacterized ion transporter superfamily protein YfcC
MNRNKQVFILILVIVLTAICTYFVTKKEESNPYYLTKIKESLIREDSIKAELNKTLAQIKENDKQDKNIVAIYDTISKPVLIRRADSLYFRYGLHRD